MDVTCNRCGAEYEFEETIISDRGTTVKCTNCGHLFKVFHPRTPFDKSLETKPWLIRKTNGLIEPLESLADLTRLIANGHYREDDEISRTSQAWKRLGDIAELDSFFEASRRKSDRPKSISDGPSAGKEKGVTGKAPYRLPNGVRSSDAPTRPDIQPQPAATQKDAIATSQQPRKRANMINLWSASPVLPSKEDHNRVASESKEPKLENRGRQRKAVRVLKTGLVTRTKETETDKAEAKSLTKQNNDNPATNFQASTASDSSEKPFKPERGNTAVSTSTPEKPDSDSAKALDTSLPSQPLEPLKPLESLEPLEPLEPISTGPFQLFFRKRVTVLWIIFFTIIALAGWIAWSSLDRHPSDGITTKPLLSEAYEPWVREASAVLSRYRLTEFKEFTEKYAREWRDKPQNKSLEIGLSRINAVWAQALRFELLEQRFFKYEPNISKISNATYVESRIMLYAERAKLHAETAMRIDSSDLDAQIALSDALRLAGDLSTARLILEQASSSHRDPTAELYRVSALLSIDEFQGDYKNGLELAEQAVAKDPGCLRTRFLLAYCYLATNETKDARVQIDKILKKDNEHPKALALARLINSKEVQSGSIRESSPPEIAIKPVPPPRKEKGAVSESEKPDKPVDPRLLTVYIQLGEEALENGNIPRAKEMFESALAMRPGSPRAESGLGFVDLEKGHVNNAIKHFWNAVKRHHFEAYIGLGEAYRQIGLKRKALSAYEEYARLRPRGSEISIAKRQIGQLREQLLNTQQTDKSSINQSADTKKKSNPRAPNGLKRK